MRAKPVGSFKCVEIGLPKFKIANEYLMGYYVIRQLTQDQSGFQGRHAHVRLFFVAPIRLMRIPVRVISVGFYDLYT